MRSFFYAFILVLLCTATLAACAGPVYAPNPEARDEARKMANDAVPKKDGWLDMDALQKSMNKNNAPIDPIDPRGGLTRSDYLDLFHEPRNPSMFATKEKKTGQLYNDLMIEPTRPIPGANKLVSISVTEDVPLKDVLIELARRADVDMQIDPRITGGVILRVKDKPFSEVVDRIAEMANLTYSMEDGVLRIDRDIPIIRNYKMNLLNVVRNASSEVSISTNLLSATSEGNGGLSSGSTSQLEAKTQDDDVWAVIHSGINNLLNRSPASVDGDVNDISFENPQDGEADRRWADRSMVLSLNRQAGVITIAATQRQHREIKEYLDYVQLAHSSQVLIEAKIMEVSLNDEFRSGIDWSFLNNNVTGLTMTNSFNNINLPDGLEDQIFSMGVLPAELFGLDGTSLEASINLVQTFGTARTLSSPRLHTMNNQYAVLTFAENFVYFQLDVEEETKENDSGNDTTTLTVSSELRTVPIGVLLGIQPSIDLERNEIVMSVRPTLSRVTGSVADPAVALIAAQNNANISSDVPVVEVRELDSILRLKSGHVMVIGGLMEERSINTDRGVPGVANIPLLGNAFKSVTKESDMVETVIFIKATILPGQGVTVQDQDFYNKFSKDRHRLTF